MKIIKRTDYFNKIKPFIGKGLIKVLTGQRRTGKSCIMQQIAGEIKKENPEANIIYINKELQEFQFITDDETLSRFVKENLKKRKKNYLFIDEIQDIKDFEKSLRSLNAKNECDIFCTGSNAQLLSGELSTFLAGRYIEIHVYGLSYKEFLTFNKLKDEDSSLMKYLTFGGLPHIMHFNLIEEIIEEYLKNIYSTILLKDIIAREGIRNVHFLENLSVYLAENTGNIVSALKINKYLKSQSQEISTSAILNYIRSICNAFVINKAERYDIKGKRRFELNEKYYFEDHGIRNILVGIDVQRDIHKIMENVVWLHLKRQGFDVMIGKLDDYEIDFVGRKGGKYIYVQVAYLISTDESYQREFGNLAKIKDNYPKYVVSLNPLNDRSNLHGIQHIHLREFLKMSLSDV